VAGAFVRLAVIGVVINYVKRSDAAGLAESHFRWQIRTSGMRCCGRSGRCDPPALALC
jgi:uncharacterized membrane protein